MTPAQKTFTGIAAFLPFITMVVYIIVFLGFFMNIFEYRHDYYEPDPEEFIPGIFIIIATAIVMGLITLGIMVYFIIHCINNKQVRSDERVVWILVFIFAGLVGYPIYWFMRILKDPDVPATA